MFLDFWSSKMFNAYIIAAAEIDRNLVAKLYTFFPYEKASCGKVNSIVDNEYRNDRFVFQLNAFAGKFQNMNQCLLHVLIPKTSPFIFRVPDRRDMEGIEARMLKYLSNAMNFRLHLIPLVDIGRLKDFGIHLV